ncbi:unnamed protein product [Malus baccata var. baccata]
MGLCLFSKSFRSLHDIWIQIMDYNIVLLNIYKMSALVTSSDQDGVVYETHALQKAGYKMAESVVCFVIDKLISLLITTEAKLSRDVRAEVGFLRDELESIRSFLKDADAKAAAAAEGDLVTDSAKTWVKQVRETAFYIEDVIDEYLLRVTRHHQDRGFVRFLHKVVWFLKKMKSQDEIASKIEGMRALVSEIKARHERYGLNQWPESFLSTLSGNFKLLKILDFANAPLNHLPKYVGDLHLLKYLSLRNTKVKLLPESICNLQNLETLDLKQSLVYEIPAKINKLLRLRHLLAHYTDSSIDFSMISYERGVKIHDDIGCLQALQELYHVETNHGGINLIKALEKLRQLRKLGLKNLKHEYGRALCASVEKMNHLESLEVSTISEDEVLDLQSISTPPKSIRFLYLKGPLEKLPSWIPKLQQLVKLRIFWSRLTDAPLKALQNLPNLVELGFSYNAYDGVQLHFEGGFKELRVLKLKHSPRLNSLIIDNGAMPLLRELQIGPSPQLKEVPSGIQHLRNLSFLRFVDMPKEFRRHMDPNNGQHYWIVEHIQDVLFSYKLGPRCDVYETHALRDSNLCFVCQKRAGYKMAEQIICFVIDKLIQLLITTEANLSRNARTEVGFIKDELESIRSFLKEADAKAAAADGETGNDGVKTWVNQVREAAFYIEDVIDEYLLRILRHHQRHGFLRFFHKIIRLRNTKVKLLPDSIGNLQNLETLDLKQSLVYEIPATISKLVKLRHLLAYHRDYNYAVGLFWNMEKGVKIHEGIGCLHALQKLSYVEANHGGIRLIKELEKLRQLRKLGLKNLKREDGRAVCASVEKMNYLESLILTAINEDEVLDLESISTPPQFIRSLRLIGRLEQLPGWISNLQHLVSLGICWSRLRDSPLKALQNLPNLLELFLYINAYDGVQLHFEEGGFQKLRELHLREMMGLNSLIIDNGVMPLLQEFHIGPSRQLKELPSGIHHLRNLTYLYFYDMPKEFVRQMDPKNGQHYWIVEHIQNVRFRDKVGPRWGNWWSSRGRLSRGMKLTWTTNLMRQRFYDFTRQESDWEAEEWFRSAGGYQPSPFLEKLLNWQKENHPLLVKTSVESKDVEITRCNNSNNCMEAEVSTSVDDNDKAEDEAASALDDALEWHNRSHRGDSGGLVSGWVGVGKPSATQAEIFHHNLFVLSVYRAFRAVVKLDFKSSIPHQALQNLPNLLELVLKINAYDGVQLHLEKGGFQKLRHLELRDMEGLNSLIMDNGVMPLLQEFRIGPSPQLKEVLLFSLTYGSK